MRGYFRTFGWLEALSVLALFGVAMPLKYIYGMPEAVRVPGLLHGLFFMAYVGLANYLAEEEKWPSGKKWAAYLASVIPFGTIWFEFKYMREPKSPTS